MVKLVALLKEQCAPGDFILFKVSSKMHLVVHTGSAFFAVCPSLTDRSFAESVRYAAEDAFAESEK